MPPRTNGPLQLAVVINIGNQEINRLLNPLGANILIADCKQKPLQHMARGLYLTLHIRFVPTTLEPVGAEAAVRVLELPRVFDELVDELRRAKILTLKRLSLKDTLLDREGIAHQPVCAATSRTDDRLG